MRRTRTSDPTHYSLLVDYYLSENREDRVWVTFRTYYDDLTARLTNAFELISLRPVTQVLATDVSDKTQPIRPRLYASQLATYTNMSILANTSYDEYFITLKKNDVRLYGASGSETGSFSGLTIEDYQVQTRRSFENKVISFRVQLSNQYLVTEMRQVGLIPTAGAGELVAVQSGTSDSSRSWSALECLALLGGLAYFLLVVLGRVNRMVVENFYRAELIRHLYSEKDLMQTNLPDAPITEPSPTAAVLMNTSTYEMATPGKDGDTADAPLSFSCTEVLFGRCCGSRSKGGVANKSTILFSRGVGMLEQDLDVVCLIRQLRQLKTEYERQLGKYPSFRSEVS